MFVIAKEFQGQEISRVEDPNPTRALGYLKRSLLEISMDPRFSLKVSVRPFPIGVPVEEEKHLTPFNPDHLIV